MLSRRSRWKHIELDTDIAVFLLDRSNKRNKLFWRIGKSGPYYTVKHHLKHKYETLSSVTLLQPGGDARRVSNDKRMQV